MTNEQINITIEEIIRPALHGNIYRPALDFCNDLNAMHEAVIKTFQDSSIQLDYSRMLIFVIKKSSPICKRFFSDFDLANATATQRAEAFLRTLGKWEE